MREVEQFAWHEFADHYIEMVKHRTRDPEDEGVRYTLYTVCLGIMKMMAPLMPHVTEEVYQECFKDLDGAISIHVSEWPTAVLEDGFAEAQGESIKDVIGAVRNWKSEQKMPLNQEIASIEIIGPAANLLRGNEADISETTKAKEIKVSLEGALQERVVGIKPVPSRIGPTFKAKAKEVTEALKALDPQQAFDQLTSGKMIEIMLSDGTKAELDKHFVELQKELMLHGKAVNVVQLKDLVIAIEK
jgi:valyl-tRNA synthetase